MHRHKDGNDTGTTCPKAAATNKRGPTMPHARLHTHQYFDIPPGHSRRSETAIRWNEGLPAEWQEQVIIEME